MNGLVWIAQNWRSYLGASGVAGIAALLATTLLALLWLQPQVAQRRQLQEELRQAQQPARQPAESKPKMQLSDFYRQFPHLNTAPDWLDRIDQKLDAHKLVLKQADYKLVRERNTPLLRYQLTLPVNGPYLEIRTFVQELQQAMPFVVVDELAFEREAAAQATAQAKIRLSLMFGGS